MFFFFSSRRRHTRCGRDWSSDVCSSDLRRRGYALSFNPTVRNTGLEVGEEPFQVVEGAGDGRRVALFLDGGTEDLEVVHAGVAGRFELTDDAGERDVAVAGHDAVGRRRR